MHARTTATPVWVRQAIRQQSMHRGYVTVQRLHDGAVVSEDTLRQQDELLATEVSCIVEDLLVLEQHLELQRTSAEALSGDLEVLRAEAKFCPSQALESLCQTATRLFCDESKDAILELPTPHPPKSQELLALIVFAQSMVNEMIPCLTSKSGIGRLLDIIERAVPVAICDCLFFNIYWPSATPHKKMSPLAAGVIAHVQVCQRTSRTMRKRRPMCTTSLIQHVVLVVEPRRSYDCYRCSKRHERIILSGSLQWPGIGNLGGWTAARSRARQCNA